MKSVFLASLFLIALAGLPAGISAAGNIFSPAPGYHKTGGISNLFGGSGGQGQPADNQHPIRDDKTFETLTTVHTVVPFRRADLSFSINIPKDWSTDLLPEETRDLGSSIIGDIARFSSPMVGIKRMRLAIHAAQIEHEIAVAHWLRNYILMGGFAPEGDVVVDPQNPRRVSASFVSLESDGSSYNYITAQLSGNILMMARYQLPQNLRDYAKFLQKKTIDSFTLTYPKMGPIEGQSVITMMDAAKLSFPKSWETAAQNFRDINRLSIQLHNKNAAGGLDGLIMVHAVRRHRVTSMVKELEELKKYLGTHMNMEVKDMISSGKSVAADRFLFNRYEIYNVESHRRAQSRQNLHLVALGDREWYLLIFLVTAREEDRLYTWARNVQTLQEIVRTIR